MMKKYCKACDTWLNGPEQFRAHLTTKKHKLNAGASTEGTVAPATSSRAVITEVISASAPVSSEEEEYSPTEVPSEEEKELLRSPENEEKDKEVPLPTGLPLQSPPATANKEILEDDAAEMAAAFQMSRVILQEHRERSTSPTPAVKMAVDLPRSEVTPTSDTVGTVASENPVALESQAVDSDADDPSRKSVAERVHLFETRSP